MKKNLLSFRSTLTVATLFIASMVTALSLVSCGGGGSDSTNTAGGNSDDNSFTGAGSTFDNPLFSKVFSEYNKLNGLKVNYQSIGSGGGILQLTKDRRLRRIRCISEWQAGFRA
jgi:phosphate transport system substrate-binding protein